MRDRSPIHDQSFRRGDNHDPKPVTWTADPDKIMATVSRFDPLDPPQFDSFMSGLPDNCRRSLASTDIFYRRAGAADDILARNASKRGPARRSVLRIGGTLPPAQGLPAIS